MYGIPTGREGRVRVLLYVTACGTCSTSSDDNPQGQPYRGLSFPMQVCISTTATIEATAFIEEPRGYTVHS